LYPVFLIYYARFIPNKKLNLKEAKNRNKNLKFIKNSKAIKDYVLKMVH